MGSGSVFERTGDENTKAGWFLKYKDANGVWRMHVARVWEGRKWGRRAETEEEARDCLKRIEMRLGDGQEPFPKPKPPAPTSTAPTFGKLATEWAEKLKNRSADIDKGRVTKHLVRAFGTYRLADITHKVVMRWLEAEADKKGKGALAPATVRHCLNLLSRFFGWAIKHDHAQTNPVRAIPTESRPQQTQKHDEPWLDDDALVRRLVNLLPEPINLMLYLGNRSGLRVPGEACGLRLADLGFLDEGTIRVRHSYDDALKEDRRSAGKVKWVPAPEDAKALLGPYLDKRRAAGAGPEDFAFVTADGSPFTRTAGKQLIHRAWKATRAKLAAEKPPVKLALTMYQCTRHAFVSRSLSHGASLDEVSAAVGHSSPVVTKRYYDHLVRRSFSSTLREGLGLGVQGDGKVLPMRGRKGKASK
jgi:integrase